MLAAHIKDWPKEHREDLFHYVKRLFPMVDRVLLVGSFAYGEPHACSDLDIVVVTQEPIPARHKSNLWFMGARLDIHAKKTLDVANYFKVNSREGWRKLSLPMYCLETGVCLCEGKPKDISFIKLRRRKQ